MISRGASWLIERGRRGRLRLSRGATSVVLDLRRGRIESLRVGAREVLSSPLALSVARAVAIAPATARRVVGRAPAPRVRRRTVAETESGVEVALEVRSRVALATVTVSADEREGVLVQAVVRPRREPVAVGFRAGLDTALDRVQWARRTAGADGRRPARLGWHRRTLAQLRSAISRGVEDGGVDQVSFDDGDVLVRVQREGATPFRFAVTRPDDAAEARRRELRMPETVLEVELEAPPAPSPDGQSARFRLTWGPVAAADARRVSG